MTYVIVHLHCTGRVIVLKGGQSPNAPDKMRTCHYIISEVLRCTIDLSALLVIKTYYFFRDPEFYYSSKSKPHKKA